MRKLVALCALLWTLGAAAVTPEEIAAQLQKTPQIHGQFEQLRHLRGMDKPLVGSGTFALVAKQGLWWSSQEPIATLLKVSPQGVAQWQNGRWQEMKRQADSAQIRIFLSLLAGDWALLQEGFALSADGELKDWTLTLTPDHDALKQVIKQIVVRGDEIIREIDISETQGDHSELRFKNITRGLSDDPRMRP